MRLNEPELRPTHDHTIVQCHSRPGVGTSVEPAPPPRTDAGSITLTPMLRPAWSMVGGGDAGQSRQARRSDLPEG